MGSSVFLRFFLLIFVLRDPSADCHEISHNDGSCRSFDPSTWDLLCPPLKIFGPKMTKIWRFPPISPCAPVVLSVDKFSSNKRLCQSTMFSLPNATNMNNFHHKLFAMRCLHVTFTLLIRCSPICKVVPSVNGKENCLVGSLVAKWLTSSHRLV